MMLARTLSVIVLVCSSSPLPTPRGQQGHGRGWRLGLHFYIPKRRIDRWQPPPLRKDLFPPTEHAFHNRAGPTSTLLNHRRCGVPDLLSGKYIQPDNTKRKRRFVIAGERWNKTDLTYKIVRFPWQLSQAKVRHTIAEAVRIWSDVTPLTFTEVQDTRADIMIEFTRYWHGDNLPFDGPGGVLAHAFYPQTPQAGNIHFDYDELWTTDSNKGTDLLQVTAHEFGHALGLQHSRVPKSLMSPYYTSHYPLGLAEDDKQGIQYLYGSKGSQRFDQEMETNELPRVHHHGNELDVCETDFDAVSMIRGELFFFKSKYVWRLRDRHLQPGYPALASRHWWGIPDHIDAGFEDSAGNFWFFQGDAYFLRGRYYWKFDPVQLRVQEGYPRLIGHDFFGCSSAPQPYT
ncbi:stromelysin-3 isoform X2 [Mustelus asterias]